MSENTVHDFAPGDLIVYVKGTLTKPWHKWDREPGIVTSTNDKYVFARFYRNGMWQHTPQACDPRLLLKDTANE